MHLVINNQNYPLRRRKLTGQSVTYYGMEYEYGKYYLDGEDGNLYLCQRTGEAAGGTIVLQYMPHELVGNYFKEVNT